MRVEGAARLEGAVAADERGGMAAAGEDLPEVLAADAEGAGGGDDTLEPDAAFCLALAHDVTVTSNC